MGGYMPGPDLTNRAARATFNQPNDWQKMLAVK
jgi:hypothetical protein